MNIDRLLRRIPLAEDSTVELAQLSAHRNEVIANLFARDYPVEEPLFGKTRLMDKRGAGVELILTRSEALAGRRPCYEELGDMELKLTIYAAAPPPRNGA